MRIEGGCHCGAIQYEAEIDPEKVSVCHCSDCQILSGAPFRASVSIKAADLTLTKGTPKTYVKLAENGNRRRQGFCGECGSPFYSTTDEAEPSVYMVRVGGIAQRDQLTPKKQIWTQSAQPWSAHIAELESFAQSGPTKK